jgi:hypothetical protein
MCSNYACEKLDSRNMNHFASRRMDQDEMGLSHT